MPNLDALPIPEQVKAIPVVYWIGGVLAIVLMRTKNFMARAVISTLFCGYGFMKLYTWFDAKFIVR